MRGKKTDLGASACAIARSLNVIGDWWSLLIIRDALAGARRFGEFQRKLGLARNILSVRLRKLVETGILETAPASDGSAHNEYLLTEKGEQLYLVLAALWQWGEKYSFDDGEQELSMVDRDKSQELAPLELRTIDGRRVGPRGYRSKPRDLSRRESLNA
ncbi:MAG: helix-turn-helix domain-containing protein [Roseiarcus sp.]|jgi:DNA-binding HxlR family transcriptional regulator